MHRAVPLAGVGGVVAHCEFKTHWVPPTGSVWQKPALQTSPVPQDAFVVHGRSQAPFRHRAPAAQLLLNWQTVGAMGPPGVAALGWQAPDTQQSVVGQSALLRQPPTPLMVDPPAAPPVPEMTTVPPPVPPITRAPPEPVERPPLPPLPPLPMPMEPPVAERESPAPASRATESLPPASDSIVTQRPYVEQY